MLKHLFAIAAAICVAGPLAAGELDKEFSSKPSKNTPAATVAKTSPTALAKTSELDAEAPTQASRGGGGHGGGGHGGWGGGGHGGWGHGGWGGGHGGWGHGGWGHGGWGHGGWGRGGWGRGGWGWGNGGWGWGGVGVGIGLGGGWGGGYWGGDPYFGGFTSYYPGYVYSAYPSSCNCW